MNWVISVLVGSLLRLFAVANIPLWLGILVYKRDTSIILLILGLVLDSLFYL